jgi:hypothetical protein
MGVCSAPPSALFSHPEYPRAPSRTSATAIITCHSALRTHARLHFSVSSIILGYRHATSRVREFMFTYSRTAARRCILRDPRIPSDLRTAGRLRSTTYNYVVSLAFTQASTATRPWSFSDAQISTYSLTGGPISM